MEKTAKTAPAKNVDEYLQAVPDTMRATLEKLRGTIKAAAPRAEEIISYQIPTYKQEGPLVHFAAFKDHCSLVVVSKSILEIFKKDLVSYKTSGMTIHFTPEKPLPATLVKKIVKERIKQNLEEKPLKKFTVMAKNNKANVAIKSGKQKSNVAKQKAPVPSADFSAKKFTERLRALQSPEELEKIQRYFKSGKGEYGYGDIFIGVRMGSVFALAKEFIEMTPDEIEKLLESPVHEVRVGGLSIMDKQARSKKATEVRRKELYDLYVRRTDRINNWDLVDVCAPHVVGGYLYDKPRDILYKFARSKNMWERRTAIVSTFYFIRKGDIEDTFRIAEMLLNDKEDLIHKAAGGWIREAGKRDRKKLLNFLDKYAATMPRTFLRYAIEHLDRKQRDHYLGLKFKV